MGHRTGNTLGTFNALYELGPYFSYAEFFGKRNLTSSIRSSVIWLRFTIRNPTTAHHAKSAIATTNVTSSLFLTAASFNLLAVGLVEKFAHVDLRWTDWFKTAGPVIGPLLVLLPLLTYWLYPPEIKHCTKVRDWASVELKKMGPLNRREITLAGIVLIALVLWVGGGAFITATTVAGVAVSLMLITRVFTWSDMADHRRAWTTLAWLGSLIALSDGLNKVGFVKWFANGIATHMSGLSPHLAMLVLLAVFFSRIIFSRVWTRTPPLCYP